MRCGCTGGPCLPRGDTEEVPILGTYYWHPLWKPAVDTHCGNLLWAPVESLLFASCNT